MRAVKPPAAGDLSPSLSQQSAQIMQQSIFFPLNPFLILCDSFPCRLISHFSSLFPRCHVGFFFPKGWGRSARNSQTPCSCLPGSLLLLKRFVRLQVTANVRTPSEPPSPFFCSPGSFECFPHYRDIQMLQASTPRFSGIQRDLSKSRQPQSSLGF